MSLTQRRRAVPRDAMATTRSEDREPDRRLAGVLLVFVGVLLMALTVGEAFASGVQGSEEDDVLRGTGLNERITGLGGKDELYGMKGRDELFAGEGDDFVEASDGEQDVVSCGLGVDVASVDFVDLVARDCEKVYPN